MNYCTVHCVQTWNMVIMRVYDEFTINSQSTQCLIVPWGNPDRSVLSSPAQPATRNFEDVVRKTSASNTHELRVCARVSE